MNFAQITNTRIPGVYAEIDNTSALQGLPAQPRRVLLIGQRTTAGSVAPAVPTRVLSGDQADSDFGRGSYLAEMCRAALAATSSLLELWACALDDVGNGTAATGSVDLLGTATEGGALTLWLAGRRYSVAVRSGDTAQVVGTALTAALAADTRAPATGALVVAEATDVSLDLLARHKGTLGNGLDARLNYAQGERIPGGLTVTITPFSGGATDPSLSAAITAMGDSPYYAVVTPFTDSTNLGALETELAQRWDAMEAIEGHAFGAVVGSHSTVLAVGNGRNSPYLTLLGMGKTPTPAYLCAAIGASVEASEEDPARPRQQLVLPGVLAPSPQDRFTRQQREALLADGVATVIVDVNDVVRFERLVTTYQTNAQGVADISFLDIETLRTLAYIRYAVRTSLATRYARFKLANDGTQVQPGQAVVTPKLLKAELIALFRQLEAVGLVENLDQFARDILVTRNTNDPSRVDVQVAPDLINQLRMTAIIISFKL